MVIHIFSLLLDTYQPLSTAVKAGLVERKTPSKQLYAKTRIIRTRCTPLKVSGRVVCAIRKGKSKTSEDFWDALSHPAQHVSVKPIKEQSEWESRRLWEPIAVALNARDYETASLKKQKLENAQRQMRKDEKESGKAWATKVF